MYVSRLCGCMYPGCVDICIQVVWMYPGYVDVSRLCGCMYPGCLNVCILLVFVYVYPGCVDICIQVVWISVSRLYVCIQVVWMYVSWLCLCMMDYCPTLTPISRHNLSKCLNVMHKQYKKDFILKYKSHILIKYQYKYNMISI